MHPPFCCRAISNGQGAVFPFQAASVQMDPTGGDYRCEIFQKIDGRSRLEVGWDMKTPCVPLVAVSLKLCWVQI
jgi:hypothetical protein